MLRYRCSILSFTTKREHKGFKVSIKVNYAMSLFTTLVLDFRNYIASIHPYRFLNLALEVAERLPNKVLKMCETLIAKSDIFIKTGDFQSAKQVLRKAYKLKSTDTDDRELVEKRLRVGKKLFLKLNFHVKQFTCLQLPLCVIPKMPLSPSIRTIS